MILIFVAIICHYHGPTAGGCGEGELVLMKSSDVVLLAGKEGEFLAAIFAGVFRGPVRVLMLLHIMLRFEFLLADIAFEVPLVGVMNQVFDEVFLTSKLLGTNVTLELFRTGLVSHN